MIKFNEFEEELKREIYEMSGIEARTNEAIKNNGIVRHSIVLDTGRSSNISPVIYLDDFYNRYNDATMSIREVAEKVLKVNEINARSDDFDVSMFTDFSKACTHIQGVLVNRVRNGEKLNTMPHRDFLDLALVYKVAVTFDGDCGTIAVTNEHLELWGKKEEDLYNQFMENMNSVTPSVKSIVEILSDIMGYQDDEMVEESDCRMWVLTNEDGMCGASQILSHKAIDEIVACIGSEEFFVLPSSIHELILIPYSEDLNIDFLREMVHSVNSEEVKPEEVLSDSVYIFRDGKLSMAAA